MIRYDSNAHVGTIVCHKDNNIRVAASAESEAETLGISESDEGNNAGLVLMSV